MDNNDTPGKLSARTNQQQEESDDIIKLVSEVCNSYTVLQAIKLPNAYTVTPSNVIDVCNVVGTYTEALSKVLHGIRNIAACGDSGKRLASSLFCMVKNYI